MSLVFDRDLSNPNQAKRYFGLLTRKGLTEEDKAYVNYAKHRIGEPL